MRGRLNIHETSAFWRKGVWEAHLPKESIATSTRLACLVTCVAASPSKHYASGSSTRSCHQSSVSSCPLSSALSSVCRQVSSTVLFSALRCVSAASCCHHAVPRSLVLQAPAVQPACVCVVCTSWCPTPAPARVSTCAHMRVYEDPPLTTPSHL